MAKTSYINISPSLEKQYFLGLQPCDRFQFARVGRKNLLLSKKRRKGISQKSPLPEISEKWNLLTAGEKTNWSSAGLECNLNGWRLFVQDYCARKVNDLLGVAVPSLFHQSFVGQLHVESPANEIKIAQVHPHFYYVKSKVLGKKSMYNPVLVTEDLFLPFSLSINYSSNLVSVGPGSFAKLYARFWYSYQGVDRFYDLEISLDYFSIWKTAIINLEDLQTIVIRYDLYIHLYNLQGDLFFDNIKAIHSGQNWARDPFCQDIDQGFTLNYYQVPKHWVAEILPEGADFESIYKDF